MTTERRPEVTVRCSVEPSQVQIYRCICICHKYSPSLHSGYSELHYWSSGQTNRLRDCRRSSDEEHGSIHLVFIIFSQQTPTFKFESFLSVSAAFPPSRVFPRKLSANWRMSWRRWVCTRPLVFFCGSGPVNTPIRRCLLGLDSLFRWRVHHQTGSQRRHLLHHQQREGQSILLFVFLSFVS